MKTFDHIPEELTAYFDAYWRLIDSLSEIEAKFKAYETDSVAEIQKQDLFQVYLAELESISDHKDTGIVRESLSYLQKRLEDHLFHLNVQAHVLKDMFSSFTDQKQATYGMNPRKIRIASSLQMLEL